MLKIQVTGRGIIPRGLGIAPRLEPFEASYGLIESIISTKGLGVKYLNHNGVYVELDRKKLKETYNRVDNAHKNVSEKPMKTGMEGNRTESSTQQTNDHRNVETVTVNVPNKDNKQDHQFIAQPEVKDNNQTIKTEDPKVEETKTENVDQKSNENKNKNNHNNKK